jgi:hypothetical protein
LVAHRAFDYSDLRFEIIAFEIIAFAMKMDITGMGYDSRASVRS